MWRKPEGDWLTSVEHLPWAKYLPCVMILTTTRKGGDCYFPISRARTQTQKDMVTCPNHVANTLLTTMHYGKGGVLVSCDCHKKGPQTRWLTTEMYSPTVPEATSQTSRCSLEGCREGPSVLCQLLVVPGVPWLVTAWSAKEGRIHGYGELGLGYIFVRDTVQPRQAQWLGRRVREVSSGRKVH